MTKPKPRPPLSEQDRRAVELIELIDTRLTLMKSAIKRGNGVEAARHFARINKNCHELFIGWPSDTLGSQDRPPSAVVLEPKTGRYYHDPIEEDGPTAFTAHWAR